MQHNNFTITLGNKKFDFSQRPHIMGILNVTPDSFSDGGKYVDVNTAVSYALQMLKEGADIIDIGGESTRPGAKKISVEEELQRVIPVIEKLTSIIECCISIDTYKSKVADESLNAGASIVNDISGLQFDSAMAEIVAKYDAAVVLMHIQGTPETMQKNPTYNNIIEEIKNYLQKSIEIAHTKKINKIILDVGIGFGKTLEHNLQLLKNLKEFQKLNYPLLVGVSRKNFIGTLLNLPVEERLEGTAAAVAVSIMNGANIIRVHDVKEMKRVATIVNAIQQS